MKIKKNIKLKKIWRTPKIVRLDISKTKSGKPFYKETGQGHSNTAS